MVRSSISLISEEKEEKHVYVEAVVAADVDVDSSKYNFSNGIDIQLHTFGNIIDNYRKIIPKTTKH